MNNSGLFYKYRKQNGKSKTVDAPDRERPLSDLEVIQRIFNISGEINNVNAFIGRILHPDWQVEEKNNPPRSYACWDPSVEKEFQFEQSINSTILQFLHQLERNFQIGSTKRALDFYVRDIYVQDIGPLLAEEYIEPMVLLTRGCKKVCNSERSKMGEVYIIPQEGSENSVFRTTLNLEEKQYLDFEIDDGKIYVLLRDGSKEKIDLGYMEATIQRLMVRNLLIVKAVRVRLCHTFVQRARLKHVWVDVYYSIPTKFLPTGQNEFVAEFVDNDIKIQKYIDSYKEILRGARAIEMSEEEKPGFYQQILQYIFKEKVIKSTTKERIGYYKGYYYKDESVPDPFEEGFHGTGVVRRMRFDKSLGSIPEKYRTLIFAVIYCMINHDFVVSKIDEGISGYSFEDEEYGIQIKLNGGHNQRGEKLYRIEFGVYAAD